MSKPAIQRRPFTDLERARALGLGKVRFGGGHSFSRRFARDISSVATTKPEMGISEKQAEQLARLCWIYRRQIAPHLVPESRPADSPAVVTLRQFAERYRLEAYIAKHAPEHLTPATPDNQLPLPLTR